jgi:hypothetical protein
MLPINYYSSLIMKSGGLHIPLSIKMRYPHRSFTLIMPLINPVKLIALTARDPLSARPYGCRVGRGSGFRQTL